MKLKIAPEFVELHKQVMKQIEFEPERWHQRTFVYSPIMINGLSFDERTALLHAPVDLNECGTTACYAGWAISLQGFRIDLMNLVYDQEGMRVGTASAVAMDLLGLNALQVDDIFHYTINDDGSQVSVEDIKARVTQVTGIEFD